MNLNAWLPLLLIASSLIPGWIIIGLAEQRVCLRTTLNLGGSVINLLLVGWMLWSVYHGQHFETRLPLLPELDLVLRAGPLSLLFVSLSASQSFFWFFQFMCHRHHWCGHVKQSDDIFTLL